MTCPACKATMASGLQCYVCPRCRGEFFKSAETRGVDEAWLRSMILYYKALRNMKETARVDHRHGFLRIMGRERESWEASLYIR